MAEYLRAAVGAIQRELEARTGALLTARGRDVFTEFRRGDTGLLQNPPMCWVTPLRNTIDEEGQGLSQRGEVLVIIGLAGADPDELVEQAMDYVAAVTDAIEAADGLWGDEIRHVHPGVQDFRARFRPGEGWAIFPTVTVTVEMTERPVEG